MNYIKIGLLIILVGFIIYFYNSYSNLKKENIVYANNTKAYKTILEKPIPKILPTNCFINSNSYFIKSLIAS